MINVINKNRFLENYEQSLVRREGFYKMMFIEDFSYFLRSKNGEQLISFSNPIGDKGIFIGYFKNKLIEVVNDILENLLFKGKAFFAIESVLTNNNENCNDNVIILPLDLRSIKKKDIVCGYINTEFNTYSKDQIVKIKLNEIGYNKSFFKKPISIIDENHEFLISEQFMHCSIDRKKVYEENDINQLEILRKIFWDCRKYYNLKITLPYYFYRKENFYNMRVKIFRYIIDRINRGISNFFKINYDYIIISDSISELDLYSKYANNEISINALQESFIKNMKI